MNKKRIASSRVTRLAPNEVFVFGSNLQGLHGGGAARFAFEHFGAEWGQGVGLHGQSYAIPTMQGGVETIKPYVDDFLQFAKVHSELDFMVTMVKKTKTMREQMRHEQEEIERRNRETVEAMRCEQKAKERAAQEAAANAQLAAEEERRENLMRTKNLYPRLQCKTGNSGFTFTVKKPRITLGRDAANDVAFVTKNDRFDNMTVSGHHAEIVFNGSAFGVVNVSRSYTQGIVVNGQLCQRHTLRSGDMIGLGEALITFYL